MSYRDTFARKLLSLGKFAANFVSREEVMRQNGIVADEYEEQKTQTEVMQRQEERRKILSNSNPDENSVRAESDLEPKLDEGWDLNEQSYRTEKFFWSPISVENYHDDLVIVVDRNRHRMQVLKINKDID